MAIENPPWMIFPERDLRFDFGNFHEFPIATIPRGYGFSASFHPYPTSQLRFCCFIPLEKSGRRVPDGGWGHTLSRVDWYVIVIG